MDTPFGQALRRWRRRRGLSQLELAAQAHTSPRHVSFLETGRSPPDRDIVLRLAEALDLPLRERNALLRHAGSGPAYPERSLDDAELAPCRDIVRRMLRQHEPFPALVIDRWWSIIELNQGARDLLCPGPVPDLVDLIDGPMRQVVENWGEVAWHALLRLRHEVAVAGPDERLAATLVRLEAALADTPQPPMAPDSPIICPRIRRGEHTLRFVGTIARFGSCADVTLAELRVEQMHPADELTERILRQQVG